MNGNVNTQNHSVDAIIFPLREPRQNSARHRRIESDLEREEALHEKYAPLQKY